MDVVKLGHPILRTPTTDIEFPWELGREVADGMFTVMREKGGVGLAANQVGMSISMFVFDSGKSSGTMLNPRLTPQRDGGFNITKEGCLSVPGLATDRRRFNVVDVEGFTLDGDPQSWTCEGLEARIMQHECDHLAGRLCFTHR